jgi:Transcription factor DP/E2F/DP family winged-helix DNA-binding domain
VLSAASSKQKLRGDTPLIHPKMPTEVTESRRGKKREPDEETPVTTRDRAAKKVPGQRRADVEVIPISATKAPRRKSNDDATATSVTSQTSVTPGSVNASEESVAANSAQKPYKGLRHFSFMVSKAVESKVTTTYNEVADELVQHVMAERQKGQLVEGVGLASGTASGRKKPIKVDEKNIRRRVYDALNVLMAMDIIVKQKKEITWIGLPTTARQDLDMLEREKEFRQSEVLRKREALQELMTQQVCLHNLVMHNYQLEQAAAADSREPTRRAKSSRSDEPVAEATPRRRGSPRKAPPAQADADDEPEGDDSINDQAPPAADHKIPLPFIVVNTHSSAVIQCNMSRDMTDVVFDFSMPFEISDDNTILKRLGM